MKPQITMANLLAALSKKSAKRFTPIADLKRNSGQQGGSVTEKLPEGKANFQAILETGTPVGKDRKMVRGHALQSNTASVQIGSVYRFENGQSFQNPPENSAVESDGTVTAAALPMQVVVTSVDGQPGNKIAGEQPGNDAQFSILKPVSKNSDNRELMTGAIEVGKNPLDQPSIKLSGAVLTTITNGKASGLTGNAGQPAQAIISTNSASGLLSSGGTATEGGKLLAEAGENSSRPLGRNPAITVRNEGSHSRYLAAGRTARPGLPLTSDNIGHPGRIGIDSPKGQPLQTLPVNRVAPKAFAAKTTVMRFNNQPPGQLPATESVAEVSVSGRIGGKPSPAGNSRSRQQSASGMVKTAVSGKANPAGNAGQDVPVITRQTNISSSDQLQFANRAEQPGRLASESLSKIIQADPMREISGPGKSVRQTIDLPVSGGTNVFPATSEKPSNGHLPIDSRPVAVPLRQDTVIKKAHQPSQSSGKVAVASETVSPQKGNVLEGKMVTSGPEALQLDKGKPAVRQFAKTDHPVAPVEKANPVSGSMPKAEQLVVPDKGSVMPRHSAAAVHAVVGSGKSMTGKSIGKQKGTAVSMDADVVTRRDVVAETATVKKPAGRSHLQNGSNAVSMDADVIARREDMAESQAFSKPAAGSNSQDGKVVPHIETNPTVRVQGTEPLENRTFSARRADASGAHAPAGNGSDHQSLSGNEDPSHNSGREPGHKPAVPQTTTTGKLFAGMASATTGASAGNTETRLPAMMRRLVLNVRQFQSARETVTGFTLDGGSVGKIEVTLTKAHKDQTMAELAVDSDSGMRRLLQLLPEIQAALQSRGINLTMQAVQVRDFAQFNNQENKETRQKSSRDRLSEDPDAIVGEEAANQTRQYGYNTVEYVA